MEEWLPLVKKSPLFYGINDDELYTLLKCCASEQVLYEDGEYIFRMGESVNKVLVLLRGKACVIQENFWGHQEHIYHIKEGELFGQSYSCARTPVLPVSVVAEGGCETLFLNLSSGLRFPYQVHTQHAASGVGAQCEAGKQTGACVPQDHQGKAFVLSVRAGHGKRGQGF